ncbi:MAG: DNA-directed RNA polymerase subunit beta' [Candidatus Harrisonbacteria bacterium]|nr:DNA-directed RNA polymerase subunit beta' [Candidatus Harrisonbacteria bacterium]
MDKTIEFDAIKLRIASPEDIGRWSHGEVTKPETINYRTQRAEKDGLFSERIFGPVKDWECYCGKYRRIRYKGVICDRCGVEVTRSIVRRDRMGHIKLATPVVHIWFLRSVPSKICLLLNESLSRIEKVVYYISYIVTMVNEENRKRALLEIEKEFTVRKKELVKKEEAADLKAATDKLLEQIMELRPGLVISENDYFNLARRFGDVFEAGTGGEAIHKILQNLDLAKEEEIIKEDLKGISDANREMKLLRRLKVVSSMRRNNTRPEWMVLTNLPVLPPDLRPMVALEGGRFATSDLNDLYRRVINRNNRLKKLIELGSPEIIVINEKRMLQEAVDALIDNGARFTTQQLSSQNRPLRSLADMLKGKQGRFRQNLLGKRVDYSGRSVIVVGPELKLHQCGLPKQMALEIFKPFVINKVIERGMAHNIRNASRLIEQGIPEIWAILEEVTKDRKVLLNRAPTLHRLGVQAFQPLLIEDLAIRLSPLVCSAFNADFDGDQMAVHLPLTQEAQREASEIMLSSKNLLKPSTGEPIVNPSQDVVLGCYYLNKIKEDAKGAGMAFGSFTDAKIAYENEVIAINAPITVYNSRAGKGPVETTYGRLVFNEVFPTDFPFINTNLNKKALSKIAGQIINIYGIDESAVILDNIKALGFSSVTLSGISWGYDDLKLPADKKGIVKKAQDEEQMVRDQYDMGFLTDEERKDRVVQIWTKAKEEIEKAIKTNTLDKHSSVYSIIDSGARGSWAQPVQMMGMKGLVANPKGEVIELPIKASFKEGFSVLEYFISTHGARKGSTDTALKTAQAGYLARRLVDVCQDLSIREEDCRTKEGIEVLRKDGEVIGRSFGDRIFGRTTVKDIEVDGKVIVKANEIVDHAAAELIQKSDLESLTIRSVITCKTLYGVCGKCYGYDLGNNKPIKIGEAVGVVAAQSISEPGTQLTMRTFHSGGVAGADITQGLPRVEEIFEARIPKGKAFMAEDDGEVIDIEDQGLARIIKIRSLITKGKSVAKREKVYEFSVPRYSDIFVKVGQLVKKGDQLSLGNLDIKELFRLRGAEEAERYIVNEVQKIYASEGAAVNERHIEVVARQMLSRVKIKDSGSSDFVEGDVIEKSRFLEVNRAIKKKGGEPAKAQQLLMGIKNVALSTESFLSAASFIETAKVLINAAVEGKTDVLRGLKENVIIGRLVPVGTGARKNEFPTEDEEPVTHHVEIKETQEELMKEAGAESVGEGMLEAGMMEEGSEAMEGGEAMAEMGEEPVDAE